MSPNRASLHVCLVPCLAVISALAALAATVVPARSSRCALARPAPADHVVGFRGPHRDGAFPGALPHRRPDPLWTFATGGPIEASPIWVDGAIVVGSSDGTLYAVDAATGTERWRFAAGAAVDGPAAA